MSPTPPRPHPVRRGRRAGFSALVVLVLAGCSGADGTGTGQARARELGLRGSTVEQRADVELGRLQVELAVAAGGRTLQVQRVELSTAAFPDARAVQEPFTLQPGVPVDTPIAYGRPRCSTGGSASTAQARVWLAGSSAPVLVPLGDTADSLVRAHARACTARAVATAVPTAWRRGAWSIVGSGPAAQARGVLRLGPVAAGHTVDLTALGTTTLFTYAPADAGALPAALSAGDVLDLPVLATPSRCDPHAVAEDKQGFAAPLTLVLDGGEPVGATAWVARTDRTVALDMITQRCGEG